MAELEAKIRQIRRRLTLFLFVQLLARMALVAMVLAAVYVLAERLVKLPWEPLAVAGGLVGVSLLVSAVWTWRRRYSMIQAALAADEALGLRERLSSALLLRGIEDPLGAVHALEADAVRHAAAIQPRRDFRFRAPRALVHLVWPTAVFVALYLFMPQLDLLAKDAPVDPGKKDPLAEQTEEKMRKEAAREIKELARELEKKEKQEDLQYVDSAKFAKELERLSDDLYLGAKDKKAAVAELSRLEDEVRMEKREMDLKAEPFKQIKGLQRANQTREIQQDLKDLQFNDAAQKMQDMAQQQLGQMSAQQTEELAREMENLASELKDNQQMAEELQKAAEALEQLAEAKKQEEQQQAQNQQGQQQQQQQGGQQGQQQGQEQQQGQQGQEQQQAGAQQQQQQGGQQGQQQQQGQQGQQQASQGSQGQQGQQGQQQQQAQSQQGGNPQQQQGGQQGQQQSQATSEAMAQAAQQMQQAAQQMANQQQMMQEMQQLDQVSQQLGQAKSSMLNSQGQNSQSQGGQSPSGQQSQSQGGQSSQAQAQGQQGNCPDCAAGNCNAHGTGQKPGNSNGQGQFKEGQGQAQSLGSGGPGRGRGGNPPDAGLVDVQWQDEMIRGEKNDGEILAVIEIDAPAMKGESNVRYTQIYSTRQQKAADSMRQNEIPLGYRNAVRDYFEAINPQKRAPGGN